VSGISLLAAQLFVIAIENIIRKDVGNLIRVMHSASLKELTLEYLVESYIATFVSPFASWFAANPLNTLTPFLKLICRVWGSNRFALLSATSSLGCPLK